MNNANDISTQITNHIHQTWMMGGGVSYRGEGKWVVSSNNIHPQN